MIIIPARSALKPGGEQAGQSDRQWASHVTGKGHRKVQSFLDALRINYVCLPAMLDFMPRGE